MKMHAAAWSLVSLVTLPARVFAEGAVTLPARIGTSAPKASAITARPRVEVAFVLDTTGSMGGLIEGAKRRIWSVARRIAQGQPRPAAAHGVKY